jgi:tripartite-type tricarboxylate transporter receptor subunit TctC
MKSMHSKVSWLLLPVWATLVTATAFAQNYPTRAVRLIIPFSAGGAADVPAGF